MTERKIVVAPGTKTVVKQITVGRPVRRVTSSSTLLSGIRDVDITNLQDGSVLVYSTSSQKWVAQLDLDKQNVNGGSY